MSVQALLALIASGELSGQTRREAAVRAVAAMMSSISGLTVLRGPEPPAGAAAGPYCGVLDGDAVEGDTPTLSPVSRHWDLRCELVFFVERQTTAAATRAALDLLISQAAALLEADRTLGGVIDDLMVEAAGQITDESPEGVNEASAAVLPVTLYYSTGRNPEEVLP